MVATLLGIAISIKPVQEENASLSIVRTVLGIVIAVNPAQPENAPLLIVVTQILVSYLIEVFGLFGVEPVGFEWKKLLGAVIAIVGIVIFRR